MAATNKLNGFIDPRFTYNFYHGPDVIGDIEAARQYGLNCVALAHLATKHLFQYSLPSSLHCAELYVNTLHFGVIPDIDNIEQGDLVWFGLADAAIQPEEFEPQYQDGALINWRDFPVKHVGIHTGETALDDPLILHATHLAGTNVVWPLSRFSDYRRYQKIYSIRRLKESFKTTDCMVPADGFEPPTLCSEDRCSNPLSYAGLYIF